MSNPYKPDRLENKRVLVSGAGSGIGHAIANRFREEGAHVIAIDTPDTDLSGLQGIETHSVDLSQAKTLKQLAEAVPELHSIYINTSHTAVGTLLACNSAEWHQSFEEIVHTAFRITQAFIPTLIYSGGGSVTLMSSISGSMVGLENRCAYSAAKSALIGLTKSIAIDYASHGIRCNAICTGIFATDDIHAQLEATGDYDGALKATAQRQALGRLGEVHELAHLAVYLASDESSFTTGQAMVIDGGYSQRP